MKRLSSEQRERNIRLSAASMRQRQLANEVRHSKENRSRKRRPARRVKAPSTFSLISPDDRRNMLEFIGKIEQAAADRDRVIIDFSETKRLLPCGTLLFMARLDSLIDRMPGKITCTYPDDEVVEQLFQHIGLLERLGLTSRTAITSDRVKYWHYLQGSCADTRDLKALLTAYEESLSVEVRSQLYASLSEAITNVINHAYPALTRVGADKHWWMFAQSKDGKLFIGVCDKGIGIPDSLRAKPHLRDYVQRLRVIRSHRMDEYLIADAAGSPRSVTQMPHRGKGLPEMLEFVKLLGDGGLTIFSQHGGFAFQAKSSDPQSQTYQDSIHGTLIFWEIPLEGSHDKDDNLSSE